MPLCLLSWKMTSDVGGGFTQLCSERALKFKKGNAARDVIYKAFANLLRKLLPRLEVRGNNCVSAFAHAASAIIDPPGQVWWDQEAGEPVDLDPAR